MKPARILRRAARVAGGTALAVVACVVIAIGAADHSIFASATPHLRVLAIVLATAALLVGVILRRVHFVVPNARAQRVSFLLRGAVDFADVELALALVVAAYAAVAVTGAMESPLYPLVYGFVAFAVTVMAVTGAIAAVGGALILETTAYLRLPGDLLLPMATHLTFIAGAALAHVLLLRGLVARHRRRRNQQLQQELQHVREVARDYRLSSVALGPASRAARSREQEEQLLSAGGIELISHSAVWALTVLRNLFGAHSVALLWLDDDGERIKLREVVSESPQARVPGKLDSAGILSAVVRDKQPLLVAATKPGQLPYYDGGHAGLACAAVPVLDGPHLRGVVCVDRARPFDESDRDILVDAAAQVLRVVQTEQVFRAVERSKYEYERFYQAAALLGRALTPEQVMDTAFNAASAIVDYDAAVIALYDREKGKHKIAAWRVVPGAESLINVDQLSGLEFRNNAGLASMVVKNRHYLPAGGEPRELSAPVYTQKVKLEEVRSLLVLPLLVADEAVGTMTIMARAERRFSNDVRDMLSVIANQVAVSLENGILYRKMETMATTDGLTGLTNHRAFQERFGDMLERSARHGHKVAMLLCDVDHFKKVNDNYGHPVGDEVLRRVARVLQEVARKIDITARYGGEEFAVVLDNADAEQARTVAERIRQEVGKMVVETEKGPLRVTQSIGIAAFPEDGRERATLIERADLALYHAKHTGRNRVVTYGEFHASRSGSPGPAATKRAS